MSNPSGHICLALFCGVCQISALDRDCDPQTFVLTLFWRTHARVCQALRARLASDHARRSLRAQR